MIARNRTGGEACPLCGDDGWVELAGRGGPRLASGELRYERGAAPCKWCEHGASAREANRYRRLEEDYAVDDVVVPTPPLDRSDRAACAAAERAYAEWKAAGRRFGAGAADRSRIVQDDA